MKENVTNMNCCFFFFAKDVVFRIWHRVTRRLMHVFFNATKASAPHMPVGLGRNLFHIASLRSIFGVRLSVGLRLRLSTPLLHPHLDFIRLILRLVKVTHCLEKTTDSYQARMKNSVWKKSIFIYLFLYKTKALPLELCLSSILHQRVWNSNCSCLSTRLSHVKCLTNTISRCIFCYVIGHHWFLLCEDTDDRSWHFFFFFFKWHCSRQSLSTFLLL